MGDMALLVEPRVSASFLVCLPTQLTRHFLHRTTCHDRSFLILLQMIIELLALSPRVHAHRSEAFCIASTQMTLIAAKSVRYGSIIHSSLSQFFSKNGPDKHAPTLAKDRFKVPRHSRTIVGTAQRLLVDMPSRIKTRSTIKSQPKCSCHCTY